MLEHDRNHQTQEDMKRESQNASHESWEVMVKHQEFGASEAPHISRDPIKAFSPEERTRFCAAKLHWGREISLPFPRAVFFFGVSVVHICLIKNQQCADQQDNLPAVQQDKNLQRIDMQGMALMS